MPALLGHSASRTLPGAGWTAELEGLNEETVNLLKAVRGDGEKKKRRSTRKALDLTPQKGVDVKREAPKRAKTQHKKVPSLGLQQATTQRRSAEVLFDSEPSTARSSTEDDLKPDKRKSEGGAVVAHRRREMDDEAAVTRRDVEKLAFDFAAREEQIRGGGVSFVPKTKVRLRELEAERRRLAALDLKNAGVAVTKALAKVERVARKASVRQDGAAVDVQRCFRGRLGRRWAALVREERDVREEVERRWVEVRDRDTGEAWYFNTLTQESQWAVPDALGGSVASHADAVTLPPLGRRHVSDDRPRTSGSDAKRVDWDAKALAHSSSTGGLAAARRFSCDDSGLASQAQTRAQTAHYAAERRPEEVVYPQEPAAGASLYDGEVDDDRRSSTSAPRPFPLSAKFVLPDGSMSKMQLRQAVQHTLRTHKFDSVQTLARHDRTTNFLDETVAKGHLALAEKGGLYDRTSPAAFMSAIPLLDNNVLDSNRGFTKKRQGRKAKKLNLALRDTPHCGFEDGVLPGDDVGFQTQDVEAHSSTTKFFAPTTQRKICFNCWSAGASACALHETKSGDVESKSVFMCQNWDLGELERRYRNESIQEVQGSKVSSLRYDTKRRVFVTVTEVRHPIYRKAVLLVEQVNFTSRRKWRQYAWILSVAEQLRCGKVLSGKAAETAKILRLKNTMANAASVGTLARKFLDRKPKAPVTGTSLPEQRGQVTYLERADAADAEFSLIRAPPTPFAAKLFDPAVYSLPAPRTIPMPQPSYADGEAPLSQNVFLGEATAAGWFERFCASAVRDAVNDAAETVKTLAPVAGMELLRRTKYPAPHTIKFATFARKPTPGNRAVGGLAAELTTYQLVQAVVPPQYGNFTVAERLSIVPERSPEVSATFASFRCDPVTAAFVERLLQHQLNQRAAPTVTVGCYVRRGEKAKFGKNRAEQTGEGGDFGFRTSTHAAGYADIVVSATFLTKFTPAADVATTNMASALPTTTTKVDHTYPFCVPSARANTTLDFYHLLLTELCTGNKEQVFTNLGVQQCGEFMRRADATRALGACVSMIYRSWAFAQRRSHDEFRTDDGVPYWYDRRTGETFWEKPLADVEKLSIIQGGARVDSKDDSRGSNARPGALVARPSHQVRQLILRRHETDEELETRRKTVAYSIAGLAGRDKLPEPPEELVDFARRGSERALKERVPGLDVAQHRAPSRQSTAGTLRSGRLGTAGSSNGIVGFDNNAFRAMSVGAPSPLAPSPVGAAYNFDRPGTAFDRPGTAAARPATASADSSQAEALAATITQALLPAMASFAGGGASPMDLLKLGLGLGIGLGAQNAALLASMQGAASPPNAPRSFIPDVEDVGPAGRMDAAQLAQLGMQQQRAVDLNIPIGVPDGTAANPEISSLEHGDEDAQRSCFRAQTAGLTTTEKFQGAVVVPEADLSLTPDEDLPAGISFLRDKKEAIDGTFPVVCHPELFKSGFSTHAVAGQGKSFVAEGGLENRAFLEKDGALLRRAAEPLPEGFLKAIHATHVAPARVDYLPFIPNLPHARPIGRIKPRPAAEDWLAVGFDPWSAGKEPLSSEFVKSLSTKAAATLEKPPQTADDSFIDVIDKRGLALQEEDSAKQHKLADEFAVLASCARHSRYRDIEDAMNQPDFVLPIDYQDALGNTLLSIAVQNGNKRISKICLRRGANVNLANNMKQTVLHFAYSFGFDDLAEYLKSKGADDQPRNADGLTCYEGLSQENIQ
ncbi:hypothetical protein M885DRAFT_526843 [Pelagophyceae sp. CCMP2097]|nr:hypothetical protein M885DRAFT_526843 [Pelagophyceae sp. CCMP2097]